MLGIAILTSSFVVAALGIIGGELSKKRRRSVGRLGWITLGTLSVATLGFAFGIVSQIQDQRASALRDEMFNKLYAKVVGDAGHSQDAAHAAQLNQIANQIKAIASYSRNSSFELSNLSSSNFSKANLSDADFESALFDGANFKNAKFDGANFEGVDLSTAQIDSTTVLPHLKTPAP